MVVMHMFLWNGKNNKFLDKKDSLGLSKLAYNFLGGVMNNAQALSAFFNPTINSYRRINAPQLNLGQLGLQVVFLIQEITEHI